MRTDARRNKTNGDSEKLYRMLKLLVACWEVFSVRTSVSELENKTVTWQNAGKDAVHSDSKAHGIPSPNSENHLALANRKTSSSFFHYLNRYRGNLATQIPTVELENLLVRVIINVPEEPMKLKYQNQLFILRVIPTTVVN